MHLWTLAFLGSLLGALVFWDAWVVVPAVLLWVAVKAFATDGQILDRTASAVGWMAVGLAMLVFGSPSDTAWWMGTALLTGGWIGVACEPALHP